jgi:hypothetical protein
MFRRLLLLLIVCLSAHLPVRPVAAQPVPATKDDLKLLIHMMDKRFEAVDKRFDDVNKRFDDVNQRFNMLMWFIGVLTTVSTTVLAYIMLRVNRQGERLDQVSRGAPEVDVARLVDAIRHADPEVRRQLKAALR